MVSELKTGPRLIIDHMMLYQLMSMPGFWEAMPVDLGEIETEGKVAVENVIQLAMGKACMGCTSISAVLRPLHNKLWARLHRFIDVSSAPAYTVTDKLVRFIASKRGYRPDPIVVYYKSEAGETVELLL